MAATKVNLLSVEHRRILCGWLIENYPGIIENPVQLNAYLFLHEIFVVNSHLCGSCFLGPQ